MSFTGSAGAGGMIAALAQRNLKLCELELGGSCPSVFFRDCYLERDIDNMVMARLNNNGQICCSPKRLFIHEDIYEEFKEVLLEKIEKHLQGDKYSNGILLGTEGVEQKLQSQMETVIQDIENGKGTILRGDWANKGAREIYIFEAHGRFINFSKFA